MERYLFTEALEWMYNHSHKGFTQDELFEALSINTEQDRSFIRENFFSGFHTEPVTKQRTNNIDEKSFMLAIRGMELAVDYLEMREAQRAAKEARCFAIVAICISIIVGATQIALQIQ